MRVPRRDEQKIKKLYESGLSVQAVTNRVAWSRSACLKVLHRLGVPMRSVGHPRQAPVHEDFFDKIDTEARAYWLGFLTADGWVFGDYVKLCLANEDLGHLTAFRDAVSPGRKIYKRKRTVGQQQSEIAIFSRHMVASLAKLGVMPNKTFKVKPCKQVPAELLQHYWRGYFDGDGCICYSPLKGKPFWRPQVVGNKYMMRGFHRWMSQFVPKLQQPLLITDGIYRVSVGGTGKPKLFVAALYDGAMVYLDRKKHLSDLLLDCEVLRKTELYDRGGFKS